MAKVEAKHIVPTGFSLAENTERLTMNYCAKVPAAKRKNRGQFFTPASIALFMASLFEIGHRKLVRILDPGAGTGMLSAAICDELVRHKRPLKIQLVAYENDQGILPVLKEVLDTCRAHLENSGHEFEYRLLADDFILENSHRPKQSWLFSLTPRQMDFDFIISNPPYFKISRNSSHADALPEFISGQPNIYSLFLGLSASMLRTGGQFVFIAPRSFCSGLYFQRFRKWLIDNCEFERIHVFESRHGQFKADGVLQENLIAKVVLQPSEDVGDITISVSRDKNLDDLRTFQVTAKDLFHRKNGDIFLRIPHSPEELQTGKMIDSLPFTLRELGLEISTGPVVAFRAKKFLVEGDPGKEKVAPLLWAHNLQDGLIRWPISKPKKAQSFLIESDSDKLLLPSKNYVLIKRFTSKEQKRRIYASALLAADFRHPFIGLENHLNYLHRPKGELSENETLGLVAILNSFVFDTYFRTLNGSTQVNATEIRNIPLPSLRTIATIGEYIKIRVQSTKVDLSTLLTVGVDDWLIPLLEKAK